MVYDHRQMRLTLSTLVLAAVLASCGTDTQSVLIDLRTDYVPGAEFGEIETAFTRPGSTAELRTSRSAASGDDFVEGVRVAEFTEATAPGVSTVRVRLRGLDGTLVSERTVRFDSSEEAAGVTVVITRACRGVSCPAPGDDPSATECLESHCVVPECRPGHMESCEEVGCAGDGDCAGATGCLSGRCVEGGCFLGAAPGACEETEYCSYAGACEPLPTVTPPIDAGADTGTASDTGTLSDTGTTADTGVACTPFLCQECGPSGPMMPSDDPLCGVLDCDDLDEYFVDGSASPTGTNYRRQRDFADLVADRCRVLGECKVANTPDACGAPVVLTINTCGECEFATLSGCSDYADGTACGGDDRCYAGTCATPCGTLSDGSVSCGTVCGWCGASACHGARTDPGGESRTCSATGERMECFCTP